MPKTPPPYQPQGQPIGQPQGQPIGQPQGQPTGQPSSSPPPYDPQQVDAYQRAYQEAYQKAYEEAQQAIQQSQAGGSQVQQPFPSGVQQPGQAGAQPSYQHAPIRRRRRKMYPGLGCATYIVGFILLGSLGLLFGLGDDQESPTAQATRFIANSDSAIVREKVLPHAGKTWTIDDVPMAHLENKNEYVSDPDGYLSAEQKQFADSFLYLLEHDQRTQSAFILVGHVKNKDTYRFAVDLGRKYGISTADEHRGVTVVIAVGDRKYTIATSQGVQGVLTDLQCNRIAQQFIIPNMKAGNTAAAVIRTAQALYYTMADGFPHLDGDSTTLQEYESLARQGLVSQPPITRASSASVSEELTPEESRRYGAIGTLISLLLIALLWWVYRKKKKKADDFYYDSGAYLDGSPHHYDYDYDDDDDDSSYSSSSYSSGGSYGGDSSYDGGGSSGGW